MNLERCKYCELPRTRCDKCLSMPPFELYVKNTRFYEPFGGTGNKYYSAATLELMGKGRCVLGMLLQRAVEGDDLAINGLLELFVHGIDDFHSIARKHPKYFRPIARRRSDWPFLIGWHPTLMPHSRDRSTIAERFMLFLELGSKTGIRPKSKWKYSDPFTKAANRLLEYMGYIRTQNRYPYRILAQANSRKLKASEIKKASDAHIRRLPLWVRNIVKLPTLSSGTAPLWWEHAETILKKAYPCPETIEWLATPAKDSLGIDDAKQTPGRVRARIIDFIARRFHRLAKAHNPADD